jgi:transcriptional regulator with XRE-family HTH domain
MLPIITLKDTKLKIGELARTLRKNSGSTQQELADQLGMSRITIQGLESGKNATMDTLLKVLQHAGILGEFYAFIDKENSNNSITSLY